jgi:hypothetical protein
MQAVAMSIGALISPHGSMHKQANLSPNGWLLARLIFLDTLVVLGCGIF